MSSKRTPAGSRWQPWAYVVALGCLWLVFERVGEEWWPVAYLLYVPRLVWALPLLALVAPRRRDAWWRQLGSALRYNWAPLGIALAILLGPLGGGRWAVGAAPPVAEGEPDREHHLRLIVQNVHGFPATEPFLIELARLKPDLVMLQEATGRTALWWQRAAPEYGWQQVGEHLLGSKFPVKKVVDRWRTGHVLYHVELRGETLRLFSLHPPSPQFAVKHVLGIGADEVPRQWARMGRVAVLEHDVRRRLDALAAVRDELGSARLAIVGGDTNVAGGGSAIGRYLSGLTDAFEVAGRGFGYTFPAWLPWLRLDRVMVTRQMRVTGLAYTNAVGSDHRGLVVDVEW